MSCKNGFYSEENPVDSVTITLTKSNRKGEESVVIRMKTPPTDVIWVSNQKPTLGKAIQKQLTQIKIQKVPETAPNKDATMAKRRHDAILKGLSLCRRIVAGKLAYVDVNAERNRIDALEKGQTTEEALMKEVTTTREYDPYFTGQTVTEDALAKRQKTEEAEDCPRPKRQKTARGGPKRQSRQKKQPVTPPKTEPAADTQGAGSTHRELDVMWQSALADLRIGRIESYISARLAPSPSVTKRQRFL
jgi:hypothetical protein